MPVTLPCSKCGKPTKAFSGADPKNVLCNKCEESQPGNLPGTKVNLSKLFKGKFDSISVDKDGIVHVDSVEWQQKVNYLDEVVTNLKKVLSGLESAASWARKATYQGMANQFQSFKTSISAKINEVIKEMYVLLSRCSQTRLM